MKLKNRRINLWQKIYLYSFIWLVIFSLISTANCFDIEDIGLNSTGVSEIDDSILTDPISFPSQLNCQTRSRADSDTDGLTDDNEIIYSTDPTDPDTDDDGILDGSEGLDITKNPSHLDNDPDGDGFNNAVDADSDGDGILDGTEAGLTEADLNLTATLLIKGHFYADQDSTTTTAPTDLDTDGDTIIDGDEDRNANGKYEPELGETDPNFKDFDNDGLHDDTEDEDDDNDGMPDVYEKLYPYALNPLNPDDADEDYDNDGFTNLREYLGNDNAPGNDDWSSPGDPLDLPNIAPIVEFISDKYTIIGTEEIPRIFRETGQMIVFNESLLKVTDEHADKGLDYTWNWGDGNDPVMINGVIPSQDPPVAHTYETAGVYTITLQVGDDMGNIGEGKLMVEVTRQIGVHGLIIDVPRQKENFKNKQIIRRQGWVAYRILDVRAGDKITLDFTVEQINEMPGEVGLRVFVISEDDFETYDNNQPGIKRISREYEEYWSGPVNSPSMGKKIEIDAESDDTIYVVFDNRYYDEGKQFLTYDEPTEYEVTIEREESPVFMISMILIIIVIIAAGILGGFFYMKSKRSTVAKKVTREAAIETQRSLDREMAELELEIQDSLRKSTIASPMQAMPLSIQPRGMPAQVTQGKVSASTDTTTSVPGIVPNKLMNTKITKAHVPGRPPSTSTITNNG